mmetsp:Transcript_65390/g.161001  ORF Transcript_65390/g.161001 Transcript_65390/m.161001 type:complete len:260 (-) Transcript_65390:2191-2970(-)
MAEGDLAGEARGHGRHVVVAGTGDLLRVLEVAGVLGGLEHAVALVDEAGVGRGDAVLGGVRLEEVGEELLHGLGPLLEPDRVLHDGAHVVALERLEVGDEVALLGHVELGGLVKAPMDRLVGALEQTELDVLHELERRVLLTEAQALLARLPGHHDGGADVVLGLQLERWEKVLAQGEGAPRHVVGVLCLEGNVLIVLGAEAEAQVGGEEGAVLAGLDLVAQGAVDGVGVEGGAPVLAPLGLVVLLQDAEELADVRGDG